MLVSYTSNSQLCSNADQVVISPLTNRPSPCVFAAWEAVDLLSLFSRSLAWLYRARPRRCSASTSVGLTCVFEMYSVHGMRAGQGRVRNTATTRNTRRELGG